MLSTPDTSPPILAAAQTLREVLATPVLAGADVLAGRTGLDRLVERLNIMEVPDILPWVKPHEFLLTTAYPLRETPDALTELVAALDDRELAGLGIKLGRYLDELPDGVLELADDRGFPIVQLPDGVSFDDIFNQVLTGILNRQAELLARSERIHRAFIQIVLAGQGLAEIARELAELVDGPAAIVSRTGEVLAHARLDELDGVDVAQLTHLALSDDDTVAVADTRMPCLSVPISAGQTIHGYVVAIEGDTPLVDDRPALENAATVAALAITKEREVQAVETKYQSDLMHDLLTGRIDDPDDAAARARLFEWDLERRLIALVVQLDDPAEPLHADELRSRAPLTRAITDAVRQRDAGAAVVRFSDEVVVLTAAFDGVDGRAEGREFARTLAREGARAIGASASAGLSRPVEDLAGVPRAYAQAERALTIGRQMHGHGAAAHFDDLGVHRILSLIDDLAELRAFAEETLGELAADTDRDHDLRHTLRILLETNLNVAEAARRLHFHYNTLRYRIDKLERLVGPFTSDPTTRLNAHLALLILDMHALKAR